MKGSRFSEEQTIGILKGSVALIAGRAEAAVGSYSEVFDVTA